MCVCATLECRGGQRNTNWQECGVEYKTCRLPDVSVKAVSVAQVHCEVLEAYTCIRGSCQDLGPLLLDTWLPASLHSCAPPHSTS